jgi:hypothetical protein
LQFAQASQGSLLAFVPSDFKGPLIDDPDLDLIASFRPAP